MYSLGDCWSPRQALVPRGSSSQVTNLVSRLTTGTMSASVSASHKYNRLVESERSISWTRKGGYASQNCIPVNTMP